MGPETGTTGQCMEEHAEHAAHAEHAESEYKMTSDNVVRTYRCRRLCADFLDRACVSSH